MLYSTEVYIRQKRQNKRGARDNGHKEEECQRQGQGQGQRQKRMTDTTTREKTV